MTDRSKTAWILGTVLLIMFSPLAMILVGYQIPMFTRAAGRSVYGPQA
jgi:hypothetical protein